MEERNRIRIEMEGHPEVAERFHVAIRMLFTARKFKEARSTLDAMMERIKVKGGCLDCWLYEEVVEEKALLFEEIWADEGSFQAHLRSAEFRYVLLVVEMASSPPEIRFDRIAHVKRIDAIEDMRKWIDTLSGANGLRM